MNRVLRKRLLRELKSNFGRYLALILLIAMGIYMVVSMIGSSEVILQGTDRWQEQSCCEDGQFSVFVPLTDKELDVLSQKGTVIEPMFNLDIMTDHNKVLRLFRTREQIDRITLEEGRLAEKDGEAVLEKRFAACNGFHIGDTVKAGGAEFTVTGLGSVPDYDAPLRNLADSGIQSELFGLLFVTQDCYDRVCAMDGQRAQEYTYAYCLGRGISHDDLKEQIRRLDFDYTKVEDSYFQETIRDLLKERSEIEDGIADLQDGSQELSEGLVDLTDNSGKLCDGAETLFSAYLQQADAAVRAAGAPAPLTADNYGKQLDALIAATHSEDLRALKASLDAVAALRDGIAAYTEGADAAADGARALSSGMDDLSGGMEELLDEVFDLDIDNLTAFLRADENGRISAAAGDVVMNKIGGIVAGIIVLILFAYVISVFIVHQIEQESSVIGALYALGVRKGNLLRHYITLPTIIAFLGAVIGAAIGFTPAGIGQQLMDSYHYYSLPDFDYVFPPYLLAYAFLMPPLISAAVNAIVIHKRLSQTALSLLRNEQHAGSYRQFRIRAKRFDRVFRIRQMIRELRSGITVLFGMYIALLVVLLGCNTYTLCTDVRDRNVADTRYGYMYLYKYPEEKAPAGSERAYVEGLKTEIGGYTLEVSVIGLEENSRYFDADPQKGKSKAVVNTSIHERLGCEIGDRVIFSDPAADTDYSFTVTGIANYSPGFTVFMDIRSMRELFGKDDDYYNAVFSDTALDIDEGRLYSVTTKGEIRQNASVFINIMTSFIVVLLAAGTIIFCVVMYLMLSVMIDRSAQGISLIKIFGYRPKEVRRLYLQGNFYIVAAGALICIPAAKLTIDAIYPIFISNVACGMRLSYPWYAYAGIYAAILLVYAAINLLLMRKINRITPAEVLKNRE